MSPTQCKGTVLSDKGPAGQPVSGFNLLVTAWDLLFLSPPLPLTINTKYVFQLLTLLI
ncbi:hypothetical protein J6590_081471 [Homalodisca vitripennis]|nr:hypothetical protein J6590_081471 [Homalodisca vitripennis]